MYGDIAAWGMVRAEDYRRAIANARSKGYVKANCRIHSMGGSIFEGLAMISQGVSKDIEIHAHIEGVACSMASVFAASCDKCYMVKGTRMMIHQGSGGVMGSSNQIRNYADLLDSLNKTLADVYAKRTGKEAKWILENWMAEGKDTWFTAEEALAAGLIDGITDGDVKPMPGVEKASFMEMAAHYDPLFKTDKTENKMNKEELIALLGLKAEATDVEIKAAMTANKTAAETAAKAKKDAEDAGKKHDAKTDNAGKDQVVEGIVALGKERGMDDKQLASLKVLAGVDVKAAMDMLPAKDVVPSTTVVNISEMIHKLSISGGAVNKSDEKTWDYDEYEKHPEAFSALLKSNPAKYQEIFNAKFGYKPSLDELNSVTFKR